MGVQREGIAKGKISELENSNRNYPKWNTEMRFKKQAEHQCTLGQLQAA